MAATVIQNRDRSPLSMDQLRDKVPSIFAAAPHDSRSSRYLYVPTVDMLGAMEREGFVPVWASQSKSRDAGKAAFTKHMIRLRRPSDADRVTGLIRPGVHQFLEKSGAPVWPEIVLTNSHDGSSSVQLSAGLFRLACTNGLIVSEGQADTYRMQHSAKWRDDIIEGTYRVIDSFDAIGENVAEMTGRTLSEPERLLLAEHAATLRWHGEPAPIQPRQLLARRRRDDAEPNAWNTLNILQENVIRGGIRYTDEKRHQRQTRPITGIDDIGRLNRGVWDAVATLATGNRVDLAAEMLTRLSPEEREALRARLA